MNTFWLYERYYIHGRLYILSHNHMFTKIISNLLIWMCIREIIFIKRENRTLVSNAFLISCVWSLNSISLRLSNSLIYVSVQLPIFMHPLTGWTSFLLYNHPRWTRYMFCIQIDKIKCISFSLSLVANQIYLKRIKFSQRMSWAP